MRKGRRCNGIGLLAVRPECLATLSPSSAIWHFTVGHNLTGMWIVALEMKAAGQRVRAVISVKTILRGAHLIGVYGEEHLPASFHFSKSLNAFNAYYVNKYIDHHSFTLC